MNLLVARRLKITQDNFGLQSATIYLSTVAKLQSVGLQDLQEVHFTSGMMDSVWPSHWLPVLLLPTWVRDRGLGRQGHSPAVQGALCEGESSPHRSTQEGAGWRRGHLGRANASRSKEVGMERWQVDDRGLEPKVWKQVEVTGGRRARTDRINLESATNSEWD
jgi:hypothetical protein